MTIDEERQRRIEELEKLARDASMDHIRLRNQVNGQARAASQAVIDKYADQLIDAEKRCERAKRALGAAVLAETSKDPLVGRKVHRKATTTSFGVSAQREAWGVIEAWGENLTHRKAHHPNIGDLVIRILKKDGSLSQSIVNLRIYGKDKLPMGWTFMEEEK